MALDILKDYCNSKEIELENKDDSESLVKKIEKLSLQEKPRLRLTQRLLANSSEFKKVIYHFNLENDLRRLLYNLRLITELKN